MPEHVKDILKNVNYRKAIPAVSAVLDSGQLLETIFDPATKQTSFVVWENGKWSFRTSFDFGKTERWVPYSPRNNLIRNEFNLRHTTAYWSLKCRVFLFTRLHGFNSTARSIPEHPNAAYRPQPRVESQERRARIYRCRSFRLSTLRSGLSATCAHGAQM